MVVKVPLTQEPVIKRYIEIAFTGDSELLNYYDKSINVSRTQDMVEDTCDKILQYQNHFDVCSFYGIEINGEKSGYFFIVKSPDILVSFSLNKKHRNRQNLSMLFDEIKKVLDGTFLCFLNEYNTRAIKWLEKCGMTVSPHKIENRIAVLNYNICQ